jgi:excisionase family DNA binding protein
LAEAYDHESYLQKLEIARIVLARYEERLASGDVEIKDLVVSKRITKEPRDYLSTTVPAIRRLISTCEFPFAKLGKRLIIDRQDLDKWLEKKKHLA